MEKTYRLRQARRGSVAIVSLLAFILVLQICLLVYLTRTTHCWSILHDLLINFYKLIEQHAWSVVFSLMFLPTFGLPISPLLILAGALWGIKIGLIISFICIGFNLVFSYVFYRKCLNKLLFKLIFRKTKLPDFSNASERGSLKMVFLIQLIPQFPYAAQCYILSTLNNINFWHYLSISWLFQALWALGFICGGSSIVSKQWEITFACLILLAIYLTYKGFRFYFKKLKNSC